MSAAMIHRGVAVEGVPNWILGRLCAVTANGATSPREVEGNLVIQSDVDEITLKAFDSSGVQIGTTQTLTVADVIFDTLQTTKTWKRLKGGGNFRYLAPASLFPTGGVTEKIEVLATLQDGSLAPGLWEVDVLEMEQS